MILLQERDASPTGRKLGSRDVLRFAPVFLVRNPSTLLLEVGAPGAGRWAGLRG